jgi:hypothetical protein
MISLPKPLTSFISRERELAQARRLLQDSRLAARGRPGHLDTVTGYLGDLLAGPEGAGRQAGPAPGCQTVRHVLSGQR